MSDSPMQYILSKDEWDYFRSCEKKLAAALAACELKDRAALKVERTAMFGTQAHRLAVDILNVPFGKEALRELLGAPVAWRTREEHGSGLSYWTIKTEKEQLDDSDWEPLYTLNEQGK